MPPITAHKFKAKVEKYPRLFLMLIRVPPILYLKYRADIWFTGNVL